MRKSVCLAVVGIAIVVAGSSLGVTLTRYLGLLAYSPKGTVQAAATPAGHDAPATPAEEWNNLFAPGDGMKLASRLPEATGKGAPGATHTSFVLVGTIASSSPAARRAILWANGMKEPKAFREKEEIEPGAFLASVERDKAWITRGKEREKLEILPVGSRARITGTGASAAASPATSATVQPASSPGGTQATGIPRPSPGVTQTVGAPKASRLDEDGESSESIQDRIRRLRGNRR